MQESLESWPESVSKKLELKQIQITIIYKTGIIYGGPCRF
jgi:hypothetical protein